jgi:hypothetical protein
MISIWSPISVADLVFFADTTEAYQSGRYRVFSISSRRKHLFPPKDRLGSNQSWPVIFSTVAHGEGISVCKVIRDVSVIGKRNRWSCLCQAHMISVILFVAMWEQMDSRFLTSADDGEQHFFPPGVSVRGGPSGFEDFGRGLPTRTHHLGNG